jgi:hypothetical protein
MKKLSLMIAMGIASSIAIAKPGTNVSQFETYSQQMQQMSAKYVADKKFDYAGKTTEKWLETYNSLSDKDKTNYSSIYADIMYNQACAYAQTNELYKALKALKNAVNAGYSNASQIQNDENLNSLKQFDEFKKIVKSIKS